MVRAGSCYVTPRLKTCSARHAIAQILTCVGSFQQVHVGIKAGFWEIIVLF